MIDMPPVRQMPSPNYTPTMIRHDLVIVHKTEGGYAGACVWLCDPRAKASAHLVMKADGSEVTQLVPLQFKAWAQMAFNGAGISLEIEGYTRDLFIGETMHAAAKIVAWLCREYGIPPAWAKGGQGRGVCQHHDLGAAGGGHVDCCGVGSWEWMDFLSLVRAAFTAFGDGPLPPFALHGLPVGVAPPMAADAPSLSHGGATRAEHLDAVTAPNHSTRSGYPDGSVANLQWLLRAHGEALDVDGFSGPQTRRAVVNFQVKNNLFIDGIAGPATLAALEKP